MQITDLSHLENIGTNELVYGGSTAVIGSYASAWGDDSLAMTNTNLRSKTNKKGKSKFKGEATALAIGEYPIAENFYETNGFSKIKVNTFSEEGEYFAAANLKIKGKT